MTAYRIAKGSAEIGVAVVFALLLLRFGPVFALQLVLVALLLFGGASLAGAFVEFAWKAARRTAARLRMPCPRAVATVAVVTGALALVLVALSLSGARYYHVAFVTLSSALFLAGGCITGERWLSSLWNMVARLARKGVSDGVKSNG